ncbi:MAG: H-NS histone family protein [Halochromatium sp.]|uniref:H-NS histone family protein n=1 Tax=Halochromatium sp. TaxID=2049430 RepID=UPI00397D03FA
MEYHHLSAEELQSQIQQTKQKEAQLKQALSERREVEKLGLAQEIRHMIEERGHDLEEIAEQLLPRRLRGAVLKKPRKFGSGRYTRYVDPDNPDHVYVRGVLPSWMKDKMAALGLDPNNKEDRDFFKANHMQVFPG